MKKSFLCFGLVLMTLTGMVGCGSQNNDSSRGTTVAMSTSANGVSVTTGGDSSVNKTSNTNKVTDTTSDGTNKITTTEIQWLPTSTTAHTTKATTTTAAFHSISLNDSRIAYLSRTEASKQFTLLDWSGSGFELAVRGGTVKANLSGPDASLDAAVWMAVYVDGQRVRKFPLKNGENEWYTLAENLPVDKVTAIRVVKLSEASWGKAVFQGLLVSGALESPALPERRIVWIGDSITCGFGVLGKKATDPFSTKTQDVTLTYGWILSEALNAQRHIVSVSGYGVATANTGSTTDALIPKIYPYTQFGGNGRWNYDNYQPDLVMVNLGTNDVFGGSSAETLCNGVRSFLTQLRAAHPNATIVWVYGFMLNNHQSAIKAEVEAFAKNDSKVHFLPAAIAKGNAELGSGGHPSDDAHARLAKTLLPQVKEIMGW